MLFSKFNRGVKSQSRFYKLYYNLRNLLWETGTKNFKMVKNSHLDLNIIIEKLMITALLMKSIKN